MIPTSLRLREVLAPGVVGRALLGGFVFGGHGYFSFVRRGLAAAPGAAVREHGVDPAMSRRVLRMSIVFSSWLVDRLRRC
jgi:hypothetical protein